ncbi:MAG: hypothetical protein BWY44_00357 [Candidatus Omnitrophica bacterium ADurb.Bin292]|nr:MAG: hypothetical protein BWY44_00357 [Candidatus Omnitrophica bacterium ADurb.Bin292]
MDHALPVTVKIIQSDTELLAVTGNRLHLLLRDQIPDIKTVLRRHIMVHGRERQFGMTDLASRQTEPFEGLRARHFMDKMTVNKKNRRPVGKRGNHMFFPDFFKQCFWHRGTIIWLCSKIARILHRPVSGVRLRPYLGNQ